MDGVPQLCWPGVAVNIDLDAALREHKRQKEPATFTLDDTRYTLKPNLTLQGLAEITAAPERDKDEDGYRKGVVGFLTDMVDGPQPVWDEVPTDVLDVLISAIAEEYLSRPTVPPSDSSPGPATAGRSTNSTRTKKASPKRRASAA